MNDTAQTTFDPQALAQHLPPAALRYLTHAIRPGVPLARRAEVSFHGSVRMKPRLPWLSFRGRETIELARAYHVTARAHLGPIPVTTQDWYARGDTSARILLFGFVPVMRRHGTDAAVRRAAGWWWSPPGSHLPSCRNMGRSGLKRTEVSASPCRSIAKLCR